MLDVAQLDLAPPVELDDASATQAALLRARHYKSKYRAVSLVDCVVTPPAPPDRRRHVLTLTSSTSAETKASP